MFLYFHILAFQIGSETKSSFQVLTTTLQK